MARVPENSLKRKRSDGNLPDAEHAILELIRSKESRGIWTADVKRELMRIPQTAITKGIKSLQMKNLIKEVVNINKKGKKHFMGIEFEPSEELTGGSWYQDGKLDEVFINALKDFCKKLIYNRKEATLQMIHEAINKSGLCNDKLSTEQITDILRSLVLENEITESQNIRGSLCYRCINKARSGPKVGALASIPCGVCPRMNECTPDGIISPMTCEYYTKWLDF